MTEDSALLADRIAHLAHVTFPLGSRHKSFAASLQGKDVSHLSEKQRAHVARLAWRYRRQMPTRLVPRVDPDKATP